MSEREHGQLHGYVGESNPHSLRTRESTPFALTSKKSLWLVSSEKTKYEPVPALHINSRAFASVSAQPTHSARWFLTAKTSKNANIGPRFDKRTPIVLTAPVLTLFRGKTSDWRRSLPHSRCSRLHPTPSFVPNNQDQYAGDLRRSFGTSTHEKIDWRVRRGAKQVPAWPIRRSPCWLTCRAGKAMVKEPTTFNPGTHRRVPSLL